MGRVVVDDGQLCIQLLSLVATHCVVFDYNLCLFNENIGIFHIDGERYEFEMRSSDVDFDVLVEVGDLFARSEEYGACLGLFRINRAHLGLYNDFPRMLYQKLDFFGTAHVGYDEILHSFGGAVFALGEADGWRTNLAEFLLDFSDALDGFNVLVYQQLYGLFYLILFFLFSGLLD